MSDDSKRPFGFMLICYYQSTHQVPEMALNPEDISRIYSVPQRFKVDPAIVIKLRDGTELVVWTYNKTLKDIIADSDVAMRERLQLAPEQKKPT